MPATLSHLGFVFLSEVEKNTYRGGMLVTDLFCKPVEFRCTSPIKPNAVQEALYGKTLMPHIAIELVGIPLLKAAQNIPAVILIKQEEFLALRPRHNTPVLYARRQGESMSLSGDDRAQHKEEVVTNPVSKFAPVVLSCHWDYPDDVSEWKEALGTTFANSDLVEPFERIKNALAHIHEKQVLAE